MDADPSLKATSCADLPAREEVARSSWSTDPDRIEVSKLSWASVTGALGIERRPD